MSDIERISNLSNDELFCELVKCASNWLEEHLSDLTFAEISDSYIERFNRSLSTGLYLERDDYKIIVQKPKEIHDH